MQTPILPPPPPPDALWKCESINLNKNLWGGGRGRVRKSEVAEQTPEIFQFMIQQGITPGLFLILKPNNCPFCSLITSSTFPTFHKNLSRFQYLYNVYMHNTFHPVPVCLSYSHIFLFLSSSLPSSFHFFRFERLSYLSLLYFLSPNFWLLIKFF